jgi:hypothetical protein
MPTIHIFNCIWIYAKINQLDDSSMQALMAKLSLSQHNVKNPQDLLYMVPLSYQI